MAFSAAHFVATAGGLVAKSESVGGRDGPPPPIKKNSSGLPTASSAARAGVGPCCPGRPRYEAAIRAIAHTQHAISRAVAQLATHGLLPAAAMASLRSISPRLHFAAWRRTAGATSCPGARGFGSREDAGTCQAASTSARRTWALPARVIPPLDEVSPLECSKGASPHHEANDGARLLFQVFADAYERQSVVITTNLEFSRWDAVFGDDQMRRP